MKQLRDDGTINENDYIGKPVNEAIQYALEGGFFCRITQKDGQNIDHEYPASPGNTLLFTIEQSIVQTVTKY